MDTGASRAFFALYAATVLFFGWIFMGKGAQTDLGGVGKDQLPALGESETALSAKLTVTPSAIEPKEWGRLSGDGSAPPAQFISQVELITAHAVITEPKP